MNKKKKALFAILGICILAVVFFTTMIVRELLIDRQSQTFFDNLAADVERRPDSSGTGGVQHGSGQSDETDATGTDSTDTWLPYVDFESLSYVLPGIVGWIKLDASPIDYPVMQYSDNDYFLDRLPDGTPHRNGSIYLDYRNNSDFSDKSILIYGHETREGVMFGVLKNYRDQDFYEANPIINLHSPEKDFKIILFAGHVAHSIRDHPPLQFQSDEEFLAYIEHIKRNSVFRSDVEVSANDRIVSLVTCTYDFDDARLIIVGKILDE